MKTIDFEEVQKCILFLASQIQRLRVENSELRAQISDLGGEYKNHEHDVFSYSDYGQSHLATGAPK